MMNLKTNSYKQAICRTKSHPFKSDSLNFILFTFKRKQYFLSSIPFDFILYYWTSGYTFVFVLFNIRTLSSSDAIFPWLLPSVPFSLYIWIVNSSYMEMHFFSCADNFNLPAILNVEEVDNKNVITTVWTWILPRKLEHTTHFHQ